MLASLTGSVTTFVGDHGVYAVFLLMAVDAVFPAASELVMVYAGALASGAFPGQHVVLFGHHISDPAWAFVTMALAGTIGYVLGSLVGWWAGRRGGRPLAEQHGRLLHLGPERLERAERWFERWDVNVSGARRLASTLQERFDDALLFRDLATLRLEAAVSPTVADSSTIGSDAWTPRRKSSRRSPAAAQSMASKISGTVRIAVTEARQRRPVSIRPRA